MDFSTLFTICLQRSRLLANVIRLDNHADDSNPLGSFDKKLDKMSNRCKLLVFTCENLSLKSLGQYFNKTFASCKSIPNCKLDKELWRRTSFHCFNSERTERGMQVRTREAYLIPEMVNAQQGMFILNSLSCARS